MFASRYSSACSNANFPVFFVSICRGPVLAPPFPDMAHKRQHHDTRLSKCLPIADKVESWLYSNCFPDDPTHHNLRSSTMNTESHKARNQASDDDESSVDTTKYIKSNRTITRTKITSMTIKHYCYLSATIPTKSAPKVAALRNSRRSAIAQRFAATKGIHPSPVQPQRKRRVRCKTTASGKSGLAATIVDSSSNSGDDAHLIENRFSRRIAKRQKLRDTNQRNQ